MPDATHFDRAAAEAALTDFDTDQDDYPAELANHLSLGKALRAALAEIDRLTSRDDCPEWNCPDLSTEDRREGKQCAQHPCTCVRPPRGPITDEMVEAAACASFEIDGNIEGDYTWAQMVAEDASRADIWRADARKILEAAEAKR